MRKNAKRFGRYFLQRTAKGSYDVLDLKGVCVRWCSSRESGIAKCWELTKADARADGTYGLLRKEP